MLKALYDFIWVYLYYRSTTSYYEFEWINTYCYKGPKGVDCGMFCVRIQE